MIAQARIDSDRSATVHLADEEIGIHGENISEVRANVKSVFIDAARRAGRDLDVVIVETDATHHLRVEPTGRISAREADDRPLYGPSADVTGSGSGSADAGAGSPAAAPSFTASSFDVASFGRLGAFDPDGDVEATAVHPAVPEGATADSPSWIPPSLLGEEAPESEHSLGSARSTASAASPAGPPPRSRRHRPPKPVTRRAAPSAPGMADAPQPQRPRPPPSRRSLRRRP
jgi:hypothetical protein